MSYRIIRLASCYGFALAVTPADARPNGLDLPENAKFYRWADWTIGDHAPFVWNELPHSGVWGYFSGHADGLGFAELPEPFATLEAADEWIKLNRNRAARERMAELSGN